MQEQQLILISLSKETQGILNHFFCMHLLSQQLENALSYVTLLSPAVYSAKFTIISLGF